MKLNIKKLLDITHLINDVQIDSSKYQGIYNKNDILSDMYNYSYSLNNDDLIITANSHNITVKNYLKGNNKNKFVFLAGKDYPDIKNYGSILLDSLIANANNITADKLYYDEFNNKKTFSHKIKTTEFNDTLNLSGFQNEDKYSSEYITKGFNILTGLGNDTIYGSVLNDTISGGYGNNTIVYDMSLYSNGFGNDIVQISNNEKLNIKLLNLKTKNQVNTHIDGNNIVLNVYDAKLEVNEIEKITTAVSEYTGTVDYTVIEYYTAKSDYDNETYNWIKKYTWDNLNKHWTENSVIQGEITNITELHGYIGYAQINDCIVEEIEIDSVPDDEEGISYFSGEYYTITESSFKYCWSDEKGIYLINESENIYYTLEPDIDNSVVYKQNVVLRDEKLLNQPSTIEIYNTIANNRYIKYVTGDNSKLYGTITLVNGAKSNYLVNKDISILLNDINNITTEICISKDSIYPAFNKNLKENYKKSTGILNIKGSNLGDIADLPTIDEEYSNKNTVVGYSINTGGGNDYIITSDKNDTISAGVGDNVIDYYIIDNSTVLGNDIIKFVKNERTTIRLNGLSTDESVDNQIEYTKSGNNIIASVYALKVSDDVVIRDDTHKLGNIIFEDILNKNIVGNNGYIRIYDAANDNEIDLRNVFCNKESAIVLNNNKNKYNGNYLDDYIIINDNISKSENITNFNISADDGDNIIDLTNSQKGSVNTIKSGIGNDTVVNGQGDDTYRLGGGSEKRINNYPYSVINNGNSIYYDISDNNYIGNDTIIVDKDSMNKIVFTGDIKNQITHEIDDKGNVVLKIYEITTEIINNVEKSVVNPTGLLGQITIQDLAKKDLFYANIINDNQLISRGITVCGENNYTTETDLRNLTYELYKNEQTSKYIGTRLDDVISASNYQLAGNTTAKTRGITIKDNFGNNMLTGSSYADKIYTGGGNDTIMAGSGNDFYSLGKGDNVAVYDLNLAFDNDSYALSKDENLKFVFENLIEGQVDYRKLANDIIIDIYSKNDDGISVNKSLKYGSILLKNLAKGTTAANVTVQTDTICNILDQNIKQTYTSTKNNTYIETYNTDYKYGNVEILSIKGSKDIIQIKSGNKNLKKLSAYDYEFEYNDKILNISNKFNTIKYSVIDDNNNISENLDNLVFKDATGKNWVYSNKNDLRSIKTNNIVIADAEDIKDSKKDDIIITKSGISTEFHYSSGTDKYLGADGADSYIIDNGLNKNTTLKICETNGNTDNNRLVLNSDINNIALFFDIKVSDNGEVVYLDEDLRIIDKSLYTKYSSAKSLFDDFVKGGIVIENYFEYGAENNLGDGYIKTVIGKTEEIAMDRWINKIVEDVSSWLTDKGIYNSTSDVLMSNNKNDIQALLNVYCETAKLN